MEFEAIYSPTIMDGPVVRLQTGWKRGSYREIFSGVERKKWSAEISASRNGVSLSGDWPIYSSIDDITRLTFVLNAAWLVHRDMQRNGDAHKSAKEFVEAFNMREANKVNAA